MSGVNSSIFVLTSADLASGVLPLPVGAELTKVFVNLTTAPTAATTSVTVNKNGVATTAVAPVAVGAFKGNLQVVNPYIGVNAAAGAWSDQSATPYANSAGGVNNVLPLASFAAGDTVSATVLLGTTAAGATYTLVFEVK